MCLRGQQLEKATKAKKNEFAFEMEDDWDTEDGDEDNGNSNIKPCTNTTITNEIDSNMPQTSTNLNQLQNITKDMEKCLNLNEVSLLYFFLYFLY